ncbi:transposase [Sorangium sp. So ce119]|uniref:transposase n=1 Tax=Sorangium sp. So ce119 TaxID=3133279 RepID=UPI003F5FDEEE
MSDDARRSAPPPPSAARRPADWTPEQKLRAVTDAAALSARGLGEFLRREGVHEAQFTEWRKAALEALGGPAKPGHGSAPSRRVRELERQLRREDKALAAAAAILVLQKKPRPSGGTGTTATSQGHGATPSQGHGARGRRRDRPRPCPRPRSASRSPEPGA